MFIGRQPQRRLLDVAATSSNAELIAVYGRRRIGKTFLVRQHYTERLVFEVTGMHRAPVSTQLRSFALALQTLLRMPVPPAAPRDWFEAFNQLKGALEGLPSDGPQVLFFDELPWLASPRSGFLPAFEWFWNTWANQRSNLVVVVCGSAASWMLRRVVRARGGLHNRVTRRINLEPFTLAETVAFLTSRGVDVGHYQTLELYLAMGGVPHYLKEVLRGESAAQAIDRICFAPDGLLRREFELLFESLFVHGDRHESVVRALASKRRGMTRQELRAVSGLPSGGTLTGVLEELVTSGFVSRLGRFGRRQRDITYRLSDGYSLFYLTWIEPHRSRAGDVWLNRRGSPAWRAWSGYAFEGVCIEHLSQLKQGLGISAVETVEAGWSHKGDDASPGAQVDLLIDRKDATITLCEMKFSEGPFTISRDYAAELRRKREVFRAVTGTRKTLQFAFVTTYGLLPNTHASELVDRSIEMATLFA